MELLQRFGASDALDWGGLCGFSARTDESQSRAQRVELQLRVDTHV